MLIELSALTKILLFNFFKFIPYLLLYVIIIREKIHWLFNKLGFNLDIQTNLKVTDYLDVTLNLYNTTVSPFRKNNQYSCYIYVGFNHPKQVFQHL